MIKKITCSAIASFAINPFYACLALPSSAGHDVYVPATHSSNEYSAGLLVLRPGGSNDYAVLVSPLNPNVASPILSPSWEPEGMNAHFTAGFNLNYRHVFGHSGDDINISWIRLHTRDTNTFPVTRTPPNLQQMTGPFWFIGPTATPVSTANGELKNKYDVLTAEFGKHILIGPDLKTRLFVGVSSLWLNQKIEGDFSGVDPVLDAFNFYISSKSKFNAGGMRFGMEGEYPTWCNISAVAMFAGSLFIGSQQPLTETSGSGEILSNGGIPQNYQTINHERYIQTIPALDGKLGLKYTVKYRENNSFTIEGGYMTSIFINAIQNYVPSTFAPGTVSVISGSVFLQSLIKTTESFSVDGPYLNFTLKM